MTPTTEYVLIELATTFQQAVNDERKTDALLLAARMAQIIREQGERPTLVKRRTGNCPVCEETAHSWTSRALPDGYVEACSLHCHQVMADAIRSSRGE